MSGQHFIRAYRDYYIPVACLLISVILESRAFTLGYLLSIIFIYWRSKNFHLSKWFLGISIPTLFTLIILLIFYFKSDSTYGRFFIYKISSQIFRDNWLKGIGLGNFKLTYLYYQANYFRIGDYTTKELLLADNTYYAFNDYFQFIIETGLLGVGMVLIVVSIIFCLIKKAYQKFYGHTLFLTIAVAQLFAICTAACFTYVFDKLVIQVVVIICLTVISFYAFKNLKFIRFFLPIAGIVMLIAVIGIHFEFSFQYYYALKELKEIKDLSRAGFKSESKERLLLVFEPLKENPDYLESYYDLLISEGNTKKGEVILNKLLKKSASNNLYLKLSNLYYITGQNNKAEQAYLTTVFMVPNRFRTRYSLYNFYKNTRQFKKAVACGKIILSLPIKIPSYEIDQIKLILTHELKAPAFR